MTIERLATDELDRLRDLRLRALCDAPHAFATTHAEAAAWDAERWRQQLASLATFAAVVDGTDVGMARGCAEASAPGSAILVSMWVAPAARGTGCGAALIAAVVEWAGAEGFERLVLDVADDNAPAIALYDRCGFEPTGETGALPPPREHVREHRRALTL